MGNVLCLYLSAQLTSFGSDKTMVGANATSSTVEYGVLEWHYMVSDSGLRRPLDFLKKAFWRSSSVAYQAFPHIQKPHLLNIAKTMI